MSWARDVWPSERARLMSGHMMPTEREAVGTLEAVDLEESFKDELKCEAYHDTRNEAECSVSVTDLASDCGREGFFTCQVAGDYIRAALVSGGTCAGCKADVKTHWRVVPI